MHFERILCMDLEMCCWEDSKKIGEIIEIGIVEISLSENTIIRKNQYYVKNEKDEISDYCTQLTGISQKTINKQGRKLNEVIKSIEKKYGTKKIFISWGKDFEYLKKECLKKEIEFNFIHSINIALLYNIMNSKNKNNGNQISQKKALEIEGLTFKGNAHSGLVDAENLAHFSLKYLNKIKFNT